MRGVNNGAFNTHMGIQSVEFVSGPVTPANGKAVCDTIPGTPGVITLDEAAVCDLDGDGVPTEMTVGEITAATVFLMNLPVPDEQRQDEEILAAMGITRPSAQQGRRLFSRSIDDGGAACTSCHTRFLPLSGTQFDLPNPITGDLLPIQVSHHQAVQEEVDSGLAAFLGQAGMRLWGDVKMHKMGSKMNCSGTDILKTSEVWDDGAAFPRMRCGNFAADLLAAILAHEGAVVPNIMVTHSKQYNLLVGANKVSRRVATIRNLGTTPINATPIRVVLTGPMTPGVTANNAAGPGPDGGLRQGAFWLITTPIPPGGMVNVMLSFDNPTWAPLSYDLAVQDDPGYSEGVASTQAFKALSSSSQEDVMNFLRIQVVDNKFGEGSGGLE